MLARLAQRPYVQIVARALRRLAAALRGHDAIVDGEIVCLDQHGKARFKQLLYRRSEPCFAAFDCLWLDGRDLRELPLIERKRVLRRMMPGDAGRVLYVSHVEGRGVDLFRAVCEQDLEGIVAKLASAPYATEPPSWIKIKNLAYSQTIGRSELFENRRRPAPVRLEHAAIENNGGRA